jgi:spermidine/putrescine transport system ATP-binding protein
MDQAVADIAGRSRASAKPVVEFQAVSMRYGDVLAVDKVDLEIAQGTFVSLLGPSGCGKTTSLRMIAGFEQPVSGHVLIEGIDVTGVPAYRRPVNMVFQHYALFPHLNVFDNVAFGLRQLRPRPSRDEIGRRVSETLELVRLSGLDQRRSFELSGGQQQRVALARALINRQLVLLLDEPLAALDRKLRRDMQIELQNLQRNVGITFVLVTHDQEEALSMSDRVCIMREGRIVQTGSPRALYDEPVNRYVADFVGRSNFLSATVDGLRGDEVEVILADGTRSAGRVPPGARRPRVGDAVDLALRPELIRLDSGGGEPADDHRRLVRPAVVRNRIFLGEHTEYLVAAEGLGELLVLTPKRLETEAGSLAPGDRAVVSWPRSAALALCHDRVFKEEKNDQETLGEPTDQR